MGFGSNIGDGYEIFRDVLAKCAVRGISVIRPSELYFSEPWGGVEGGIFTNAVLEIEASPSSGEVLAQLQSIEVELGRNRHGASEARTCDLDLLLWNGDIIDKPELTVPHPKIAVRRFVLVPLCDLIPNAHHPILGRSYRELLSHCPDPLKVWPRKAHLPSHE